VVVTGSPVSCAIAALGKYTEKIKPESPVMLAIARVNEATVDGMR